MFLMQHFVMMGTQGAKLDKVNRCHLYLQVTSLADITSGNGRLILEDVWKGVLVMFWPAYYKWPCQGMLLATDWVAWCHALQWGFLSQAVGNDRWLLQPLRK